MHDAGDGAHLIYVLPKPGFDGLTQITLTPLELLDRLAKFIPPARRHPHRYHDIFAPHAELRAAVDVTSGAGSGTLGRSASARGYGGADAHLELTTTRWGCDMSIRKGILTVRSGS